MDSRNLIKLTINIYGYLLSVFLIFFALYVPDGIPLITFILIIFGSLLFMPPINKWISNIFNNKVKGAHLIIIGALIIIWCADSSLRELSKKDVTYGDDGIGLIETLFN